MADANCATKGVVLSPGHRGKPDVRISSLLMRASSCPSGGARGHRPRPPTAPRPTYSPGSRRPGRNSSGEAPLRIGLDATPLLGARTGVGRYVASLLEAFIRAEDPGSGAPAARDEFLAGAFTLRGRSSLPAVLPPG